MKKKEQPFYLLFDRFRIFVLVLLMEFCVMVLFCLLCWKVYDFEGLLVWMLLWFYEGYGCDFGYCDVRKKKVWGLIFLCNCWWKNWLLCVIDFFADDCSPPLLFVTDFFLSYTDLANYESRKKIKSNYGHWMTIPHLVFALMCVWLCWVVYDCIVS
jgi:hypothetical protein